MFKLGQARCVPADMTKAASPASRKGRDQYQAGSPNCAKNAETEARAPGTVLHLLLGRRLNHHE